ncbi:MAG: hypothetical protein WBY66_19910 [Candidatus Acidiferrales bacterium]
MPILKAPPLQPKNVTLQLRVSEHVKATLAQYVEFLKCSESYVVSEALKLVFDRDKEFKEWTEKRTANGPEPQGEQPAVKERTPTGAEGSVSTPKETATQGLFH